jgi:hypothetical protein
MELGKETYRRFGGALAVAVLTIAAIGGIDTATQAASPVSPVGDKPTIPTGAQPDGRLASSANVHADVILRSANETGLAATADAISNPNSASFHQYLTHDEVVARFGAPAATLAAVRAYLAGQRLAVGQTTGDGLVVPVEGSASAVASAFKTSFRQYKLGDGRIAYANTTVPSVPAAFASGIKGIVGLDNLVQPQSNIVKPTPGGAGSPLPHTNHTAQPSVAGPTPCPATSGAAAFFGSYTADQLAGAYGFTSAYANNHLGSGVTVGLVELANWNDSDITGYESCYGISTTINRIVVDGGGSIGPASGEAVLDIEVIAGLAPQVTVNAYEAPANLTGWFDAYAGLVNDDTSSVISTSWGLCESLQSGPFALASFDQFAAMALQGQSFFAASGDSGSEACFRANTSHQELAVQDPASQPYVTGVGGTTLANLTPTEAAWNENAVVTQGRPAGSGGGGLSVLWPRPSYQTGPGVTSALSNGKREVPDVSASADPLFGYTIYCPSLGTSMSGGCPDDTNFGLTDVGWTAAGGTSAAAPLWAAFSALSVQTAGHRIGFLNPSLYALAAAHPADFNDISHGIACPVPGCPYGANNDYTGTGAGRYPVTAAYDMATGLGTPTVSLLTALAGLPTPTIHSGAYFGLTPSRLCDTRPPNGATVIANQCDDGVTRAAGPIGASTLNLQVTGHNGVPSGAIAVVLNMTVTNTTASSWLTVWPADQPMAPTSNLNFAPGQTVPNLVEVGLSSTGQVSVANGSGLPGRGTTDVVADVEGYVAAPSGGTGLFNPLPPSRDCDTRTPGPLVPANQCNSGARPPGPVGAAPLTITVTNLGGVPPTGVSAVVLNVTVTNPTAFSWLTIWPTGASQPTASNLNFVAGQTVPNRVIVPVGNNGQISIANAMRTTDVVVDVGGWYTTSGGTGDVFVPSLSPLRIWDSRLFGGTLGQGQVFPLPVTGQFAIPSSAVTMVANVTVTNTTAPSFLTVYPGLTTRPNTSDLNWAPGQTVPNLVVTELGANGSVDLFNFAGSTDFIVDVTGWYVA